jgi:hypothetical protein
MRKGSKYEKDFLVFLNIGGKNWIVLSFVALRIFNDLKYELLTVMFKN